MNDKTRDVLARAGKTFIQALLATAITQLMAVVGAGGAKIDPRSLLVTVGIPAIAAGLSAIQNTLFPPTKPPDREDESYEDDIQS